MENSSRFDISSSSLHILAMVFMLADHLWATVIPGNQWLTCIGRLAFPIFAFLIAEGYFHTANLRKYIKRLLIFALISEIPFNLMYGNSIIYPFHQNVIWTFLIAISLIHLNEAVKKKNKLWLRIVCAAGTTLLGFILGMITMVDYFGAGVLTVLAFYFFRGRKWWQILAQAAALYYINVEILGGLYFELSLFGEIVEVSQQGLSLFALIPIWLYKGHKGIDSPAFKYFCYAFYPAHMLILSFAARFFL